MKNGVNVTGTFKYVSVNFWLKSYRNENKKFQVKFVEEITIHISCQTHFVFFEDDAVKR